MCSDNIQLEKDAEYRSIQKKWWKKKKTNNSSQKFQPNEVEEFGRSQGLVVHLHNDTANCAMAYCFMDVGKVNWTPSTTWAPNILWF